MGWIINSSGTEDSVNLREIVKRSAAAPFLGFPYRLREVAKVEGRRLAIEGKWLISSREDHELHR